MFGFDQGHRETIVAADQPLRIVSMAPNLTEMLFALGLGDSVVAVTRDSDYPPAANQKPSVGTFWQPNIEAVIAAKPNLVITLGFGRQSNLADRLKRIGYEILSLNIEKVDELFTATKKIGAATGTHKEADELLRDMHRNLDRLAALLGSDKKVRVMWVVQRQPLRVAGRNTFVNEMIEMAGGQNAIGSTIHQYPPIGFEQVIACRPDVIIEAAMNQGSAAGQQAKALKFWRKFDNLPAVRNERVYIVNGDIVSRLGPRLYEGVETIARCLRPELFSEPN